MKKYDVFLVDADGTLLDFHLSSIQAIGEAFSRLNIPWKAEYDAVYSRVNDALWEQLERKEITRERLIETRFPLYLEQIGQPKELGAAFNEIYLTYLKNHPTYIAGAVEFLKKLGENGRVYIVTNGTAVIQKSRFEKSGLNELCSGVFVSQTVGYDKPHPAFTAAVTSAIEGFDKERAVWIGDSLSADIRAANDAKIDSVWINFSKKAGAGNAQPTFEAHSFEEILQILGIN